MSYIEYTGKIRKLSKQTITPPSLIQARDISIINQSVLLRLLYVMSMPGATAFCIPSDFIHSGPFLAALYPHIPSRSREPVMWRCDYDTAGDIYGVVEKDSHYSRQTINHRRTDINCRRSYFRVQFHFAKYLCGASICNPNEA